MSKTGKIYFWEEFSRKNLIVLKSLKPLNGVFLNNSVNNFSFSEIVNLIIHEK